MGLDRALMAAVDTEKRNSLRYTIVFSEKNYVRGVKRVFEYLKKQGFEQTLMNNYWMGDEPYNAVRGRLHCEVKDDTHDVAVVFHTGVSLKMSEERMVRFQEAMGIVFHTATLVSSEEGSEDRRQQAEDLLRQDQAWVARCANLAANKPTGVETIGKVIATKTREQRMQEKEESKRDSMRLNVFGMNAAAVASALAFWTSVESLPPRRSGFASILKRDCTRLNVRGFKSSSAATSFCSSFSFRA